MKNNFYGDFLPKKEADILSIKLKLLSLGYVLPKHQKTNKWTFELLEALENFAFEHSNYAHIYQNKFLWWHDEINVKEALNLLSEVCDEVLNVQEKYAVDHLAVFENIIHKHNRIHSKGQRHWKEVTGITLHQTGIMMTNRWPRFKNLKAHFAILKHEQPTVVQVYPVNEYLWHANRFNSTDVGIEINGCFEGIHFDRSTAWKGGYKEKPDVVTESQITATLITIKYIMDIVKAHRGKISYIHAHRQSSMNRRSDPGERVWKRIGLEAQCRYDLFDGGEHFEAGGRPIPKEWDSEKNEKY
jgi:hypothetical protein